MARKSARKTAESRSAAETSATRAADAGTPAGTKRAAQRAGAKRGGAKGGAKRGQAGQAGLTRVQREAQTAPRDAGTPGALARARTEGFPRATAEEFESARRGETKPNSKLSAPRPGALGVPLIPLRDADGNIIKSPLAAVVDTIADDRRQPKGYREVDVVATRMGYYGLKRRRAGEVFPMAFVGEGYLPSWVRLANNEDKDPDVARSRQVVRNSTAEEIRRDVQEDAGTEVPTYLGGNQRRPTNQSGDVL